MENELKNALEILKAGGLILYPTDTVWGIGCDAANPQAVKKLYHLKQRSDSKALVCLVADTRMLKRYVAPPAVALDIIAIAEQPTTIIYENAKNLATNLTASDGSVALRVPDDDFCYSLSRRLNGAIVATSANISGHSTPKSFKEIAPSILKGVGYIVDLSRNKTCSKTSSIIKLSASGEVRIIRA